MTIDILFARQPIYDSTSQPFGFELLFRDSLEATTAPAVFDGETATGRVLINAFSNSDIEEVCEGKAAFVNFTAQTICEDLPFDPKFLTLEVLESVEATPEVIDALASRRRAGFRIALDDYDRDDAEHPLLPYADIVKLEYPAFSEASLAHVISCLRTRYPEIRILAEKIETRQDFERCRRLGCDLFQGYFLARPEPVYGRQLPVAHVRILELLARLNDPRADIDQIASVVGADPYLSLRLLKLVNSPMWGLACEITSINRAVLALGLSRIRALASLLALSGIQNKPRAVQHIAVSRSMICQNLCETRSMDDGPIGFLIGLLSCLDAFVDRPLHDVLSQAPFDPLIVAAVLERQGPWGLILEATLIHERGELDDMPWDELRAINIDPQTFMLIFHQAILAARERMKILH